MVLDKQPSIHRYRLLVILQANRDNERLLRAAKSKAMREQIEWEIVIVEPPHSHLSFSQERRQHFLKSITLAEQMGAVVTTIQAKSLLQGVREVIDKRRSEYVTYSFIMIADNKWPSFSFYAGSSFYQKLSRELDTAATVIPIQLNDEIVIAGEKLGRLLRFNLKNTVFSLLIIGFATLSIECLQMLIPEAFNDQNRNKTIIYLLASAIISRCYGLMAGIIASISGFLILNIFYIQPYNNFTTLTIIDFLYFSLFIAAAFIFSLFGVDASESYQAVARKADRLHALLKVHKLVLNKNTAEEAVATLHQELGLLLHMQVVFFMPTTLDRRVLEPLFQSELELNESEHKALKVCWEESKATGVAAPYHPTNCCWRFEPLATVQAEIGVLGVYIDKESSLDIGFPSLMSGIADQVALILERLNIEQAMEKNKIEEEREKLRVMLVSSVSHDLKTPLASVIGSLSVYRSMEHHLPQEQRITLINNALDEAQRLDSFITNILDMTRIESGQIQLKQEWIRPDALIHDICKRLRNRLRNHQVVFNPHHEAIEVSMDSMMTGQALQNILDNAAKYTLPGTLIEINWYINEDQQFILEIKDYGHGIAKENLVKIFDKYARIKRQDSQIAGTGLGLAIAKAIIQAQSGTITAANHEAGGAVFTIVLPHIRKAEEVQAA